MAKIKTPSIQGLTYEQAVERAARCRSQYHAVNDIAREWAYLDTFKSSAWVDESRMLYKRYRSFLQKIVRKFNVEEGLVIDDIRKFES